MRTVQSVEARNFGALSSKQLHNAHAREPFLQKRIQPGQPRSNVAIAAAHARLEYA